MTPTAPSAREPALDALRGFAVLGILLVNVEMMRSPEWLVLMSGGTPGESPLPDRIVQFAIGWLATGKFVSTLAILFGLGAGLMAARAARQGTSVRGLLARRYAWLVVFGLGHTLIFPGDVLLLYGVTGLALLPFVGLAARQALAWSFALIGGFAFIGLAYWIDPTHGSTSDAPAATASAQAADAFAAYTAGTWGDIFALHASQSLLLQSTQLFGLPWILGLFLFGFAISRAGMLDDLAAHRMLLRRAAFIGLGAGLPLSIGLGFAGPLAGFGIAAAESAWTARWAGVAQLLGAPILAVGYLAALTLLFMSRGAGVLTAVGRMTLSAYILQSVLALAVFGGLNLYGQLSTSAALVVVAGIWTVLLVFCPLWLRYFRFGPAEWLWRALTYARPATGS